MKFELVSTTNVRAILGAAEAVEERLTDQEIMGLGLVYGKPGLGKSLTADVYTARAQGMGKQAFCVRALMEWTSTWMLKDLLLAMGQGPQGYRKDLMFEQLVSTLKSEPAIFIIDEVHRIAGRSSAMELLKDLHDLTGSAVLMMGEESSLSLISRHTSFFNRLNISAVIEVRRHTAEDTELVVTRRCDFPVSPDVCQAIHGECGGFSMRSVVERIRKMETFARSNDWTEITMAEYCQIPKGQEKKLPEVFAKPRGIRGAVNG